MAKQQKQTNPIQTVEITNFGGRLTRLLNGDMNSGFAKFATSWGYDPFSKPMNLTWFEQPVDITGPITDAIVAAKKIYGYGGGVNTGNVQQYVLLLGNGNSTSASPGPGNLYSIQPAQITPASSVIANIDSVIGVTSVTGTYSYGGSLEVYAHPQFAGLPTASSVTTGLYISSDFEVIALPLASIYGQQVRVTANYVGNPNFADGCFRPLKIFQGKLRFSNATTIATIGAAGTIVSLYNASIRGVINANSDLQTPLPIDCQIQDMDISIDGNYLLIATSNVDNVNLSAVGLDTQYASSNDSVVYGWNGSDTKVTTQTTMPSITLTALQTYLGNNLFFSEDGFGASATDGINKILTLPKNKAPWANATAVNGNFLTWVSVEVNSGGNGSFGSLYYFGGLDQENPPGLYRVMRQSSASAFVSSAPLNALVDNSFTSVDQGPNATTNVIGYGKHYISLVSPNFSGGGSFAKLYRFLINSTGTGTPQSGVYETQTQLFSKKITVKQIRVYTEPTVAGNGFQIDFIGSDGKVITNGTSTYTYSAGTDITQAQGPLERIDFNPSMKDTYALGMRITNTGSTNMTIHKVEIDYAFSGK